MGSQEESGGLVAVMLKYSFPPSQDVSGRGGGMGGHPQRPAFNVFAFMNYYKRPKGGREGHDLQSLL